MKEDIFFPGVNTQNTLAATNALLRKTLLSLQLSIFFFFWGGGGRGVRSLVTTSGDKKTTS